MKISFNFKKDKLNRGMTFIELAVVLSIFAILSGTMMFNYKGFQSRIDVKNLANDIALKLVQAQKESSSGKWNTYAGSTWKPAYGLYFSTSTNTKIAYFADLNNNDACSSSGCSNFSVDISSGGEVSDVMTITKGNTISSISVTGTSCPATLSNLTAVYKRPNSSPALSSSTSLVGCSISYLSINITSRDNTTSSIRIYPSGRIQIN